MAKLFGRSATVIIGPAGSSGVQLRDVRIDFHVKKTTTQTKNALRLSLYNLSPATREKISDPSNIVMVMAGYGLDDERLLFSGNITQVNHVHEPPEMITKIECGDGAESLAVSKIAESFSSGVTGKQIVDKITKELGIAIKELSADLSEALAHGFSANGSAKSAMEKMAEKFNFEWSILDGELQIVKPGGLSSNEAVLLTPETGLIGSPEKMKLKYGETVSAIKASSLLNPKLNPASAVKLESLEHNGLYRVETVEHIGDTHGGDWKSVVELNAV